MMSVTINRLNLVLMLVIEWYEDFQLIFGIKALNVILDQIDIYDDIRECTIFSDKNRPPFYL